jgi:hypothetical protein
MAIGAERIINPKKEVQEILDFSNVVSRYYRDVVWPRGWVKKVFWDGSDSTIPILSLSATGDLEMNISWSFQFISDSIFQFLNQN